MFCRFCGKQLTEDTRFCSNCGKPVQAEPPGLQAGGQEGKVPPSGSQRLPGVPHDATQPVVRATHDDPPSFWRMTTQILTVAVSASLGETIDLSRVAKLFPGVEYDPKKASFLGFLLKDSKVTTVIFKSGVVGCSGAKSEEQARKVIEGVLRQLKQGNIPFRGDPTVKVTNVTAEVTFQHGIKIQSLPERIPDSWYWRRVGASVQGKYNKAGVLVQLNSENDVNNLITDLKAFTPDPRVSHVSGCRLREPPAVAVMDRGLDKDGNMLMTGNAILIGAISEARVEEGGLNLWKMLDGAGLFGPSTPVERIIKEQASLSRSIHVISSFPGK